MRGKLLDDFAECRLVLRRGFGAGQRAKQGKFKI
jgi:hypothetical protein